MKFTKTLAFALLASAKGYDQAKCAVDSVGSADQIADAAVDIWAATQRCGSKGNAVKCEMDITGAAQAVGNMANIIVAAATECGVVNTEESACGRVVGKLLATTAGLAHRVGGVINDCPNQFKPKSGDVLDTDTRLGKCIIDSKNSLKSVFNIMQGMSKLNGHVKKDAAAAGVWTDFGSYLSGSVKDCTMVAGGKKNDDAACASSVLGMISELDRVAVLGEQISETCKATGNSRLFQIEEVTSGAKNAPLNLVLGAFLPITAIASFVVGHRVAKARAEQAREGSLVQELELE